MIKPPSPSTNPINETWKGVSPAVEELLRDTVPEDYEGTVDLSEGPVIQGILIILPGFRIPYYVI